MRRCQRRGACAHPCDHRHKRSESTHFMHSSRNKRVKCFDVQSQAGELGGQQGEEEGSCIMTVMARDARAVRQTTDQNGNSPQAAFGLTALSSSFIAQKTNCPPSP